MSTRSEGKEGEGKDGSEGKEYEGKDSEDYSSPKKEKFTVVDKVYEFCTSTEFEGSFEEFCREYSSVNFKSHFYHVFSSSLRLDLPI